MDSEITSGIKNVPFLPPSSPPPIELNLVPNEYDEYGDPDDIYDITGNFLINIIYFIAKIFIKSLAAKMVY